MIVADGFFDVPLVLLEPFLLSFRSFYEHLNHEKSKTITKFLNDSKLKINHILQI